RAERREFKRGPSTSQPRVPERDAEENGAAALRMTEKQERVRGEVMVNWREMEQRIGAAGKMARRPVGVAFLDAAPAGVAKFEGTEPSGCSFWRLAAEGRTFYTAPENHFNCAVGAYTHNIPLSAERAAETEQTLKLMFDLGYVKPEEVPQIPRLGKTPT